MLKKIFKIILILIVLLIAGLAAYWFFDRQQGGSGIPLVGNNAITIRDLFPFGTSGPIIPGNTGTPGGTSTTTPNSQTPLPPPRLWQISDNPQSGAIAFNAASALSSSTPFVRFVDKATGNIFESSLRLVGLKRISNTTIPKVYKALWQPSGKSFVLQYLDEDNETIKSTLGKLVATPGQEIQDLQASFLPNNISNLAIEPSTGALAFIVKNETGAEIYVTGADATSPRLIFESEIKDFAVSWVGTNTLGLLSKPTSETVGQLYLLKTNSGQLERALGKKIGLNTLTNPAGTKIFYSETKADSFVSNLFDLKTGEITAVPFRSMPEKCVWSKKTAYIYCATPKSIPSVKYPDSWYQGRISFNDTIWRMDTATGATEFLIDPFVTTERDFDAINLALDPNEDILIFTNKKDSQLWGLQIQRGS